VQLSHWPTPLDPAPRLAAALGLEPDDLWVKRDDLTDLGGGNKVRKLEHLVAEALAAGATVLVASGGAQSNHARATAAAAARMGLGSVLVLGGAALAGRPGNLALDELLGADVVLAEGLSGPSLDHRVEEVADRLRAAGEVPVVLPFGGSSAVGARGYVDCAEELRRQAPDAAHVVVAVGSGGTMAGLVAGLGAERVLGIDTGALTDPGPRVAALVTELGGRSGALRLDRDQVGEGYGQLTSAAATAMRTAARTEGLLLDPVYTGKALAGLASAVSEGVVRPGERTVFVHTGGLPGLFGHAFAAELAAVAIGRGRRG
jgi:D-cysteine desulfhydrase